VKNDLHVYDFSDYDLNIPMKDVPLMLMCDGKAIGHIKVIGYGTALVSKEKWVCGIPWDCSQ